ncbi:hypothetical protein FSARC_1393 [Fusarium sarcochroum]|uniref:Uncharacterized protein n=1 Tax=Fusarium sarcochroum TaxID=1208366 RepID=A0A8H4U9I6_9HYPO|nr:hypothetical protein FSARC_1393 [Fusarium sarcochroum]
MASHNSSASCVRPPSCLLVEKPYEVNSPKNEDGKKPVTSNTSSSVSPRKTLTPRTRRALQDYLSSSNSVAVSSVDLLTPPTGPRKRYQRTLEREVKVKVKVKVNNPIEDCIKNYGESSVVQTEEFEGVPAVGQPLNKGWNLDYPYPSLDDYPEDEEFNFKRVNIGPPIDLVNPIALYEWHGKANFIEPLALQKDIRDEYAAHARYEKEHHDKILQQIDSSRRHAAQVESAKFFDMNTTTKPVEFPVLGHDMQHAIYDMKVDTAASTRKVAIRDSAIEGTIAGEFTYHWDTSDLPPTEDQMAVLREAESLRGLFPLTNSTPPKKLTTAEKILSVKEARAQDKSATPIDLSTEEKPALYGQWLKEQSSNVCPVSSWLKEEETLAKKKAFQNALAKQFDTRFGSQFKPPCFDEPVGEFPVRLPTTLKDRDRKNPYESSPKVQVPKWFPTFASYRIIPINRRNTPENQYKELLTTVWKLESQMKNNKPNTWDKKWHEPSARWAEHFQQKSGG